MAREGRVPFSGTFEVTTSNTAEQLSKSPKVITAVVLTAPTTNVEGIKVGPSTVGATSYPIEKGESLSIDSLDPSEFYLFGKAKDKIFFFGMEP